VSVVLTLLQVAAVAISTFFFLLATWQRTRLEHEYEALLFGYDEATLGWDIVRLAELEEAVGERMPKGARRQAWLRAAAELRQTAKVTRGGR